jgi:predicted acyl esterase
MVNAPLAEYETTENVHFKVVKENWSNSKTPTHPAVLYRYNGSEWKEVDRWDRKNDKDHDIAQEAKRRINQKSMFEKDGKVESTSDRI